MNGLKMSPKGQKMTYTSSPVRRARLWVVLGIIAIIAIYHIPLSQSAIPIGSSWPASYHQLGQSKGDNRIANGTLGFGAIFALGLPDRTDKRDAMELSAALTGLTLTWSDGVRGDTMNPKAIPPVHTDPDPAARMKLDAEVGCWRGHMNILQRIVKDGLGSALILEDDADWDVRIVQQMQQFAQAARDVQAQKPARANPSRPHHRDSPYGDDWDLFWIGHLGGWPPAADQPFAIIHGDDSAPPAFDSQRLTRNIPDNGDGQTCVGPCLAPDERIVQEGGSPVCTVGYAVSQQGARKMMARLGASSLTDVDAQIDPEMTEMCRGSPHPAGAGGLENIRCFVPSPAYIKPHKARGPAAGDSDIQKPSSSAAGAEEVRDVGLSKGLMWSTRLNFGNLVDGLDMESQYLKDSETGEWRYRRLEEYRSYPGKPH